MAIKKVSVIVPMHNGERFISRCIESILNQSYKKIELIIVDDNSTDASYKIIEKYINTYPCINLFNYLTIDSFRLILFQCVICNNNFCI